MYASPPGLQRHAVISPSWSQTAVFDGVPDHVSLGVAPVLHCVNQRQGGFALRQVVAQVLAEAGFVGLVVERIVDQLKRGADVPAVAGQGFLDLGRWHRSRPRRSCAPASKSRAVLRRITSM